MNKSKYRGVTWDKKSNKWIAYVYDNNKRYRIGMFGDEIDAAKAYDKSSVEIKGKKAKTNFNQNWKYCEVCGAKSNYFYKESMYLCKKHVSQMNQFGHIQNKTKFENNEFTIHDDYAEIILYDKNNMGSARAIIDIDIINKVKNTKWYLRPDGYVATNNYNGIYAYLHNIVLPSNFKTDHIDRNRLNNKLNNLRIATDTENARNKGLNTRNTSGFTGVELMKTTLKWKAVITVNKKRIQLGIFKNKEDAIKARREAEIKYFGEFAPINKEVLN